MGFPYVTQPFSQWVKDELWRRENSKEDINQYTPFIWLSSTAKVAKAGKGSERPKTSQAILSAAKYNGCVLADRLSTDLRYPLNDTILGYDLDGNPIKIEGERANTKQSLSPSPPIITSMDIDTDGENNTLKQATIEITIFSLKQLEMFELFFLKPSLLVVLEYGHNVSKTSTNIDNTKFTELSNTIAASSFIKSQNYDSYIKKLLKYFSPNSVEYRQTRADYLKILENTAGNYDFWVARVSNFVVTYKSEDNTYNVSLTVSGGNELQMWMPIKQQTTPTGKNVGTTGQATAQTNDATAWMTKLCSELLLPAELTTTLIDKALSDEYKNEFFNYGKNADSNDKDSASKDEYVSFKLILDILNNVEIVKSADKKINYDIIVDGSGKPVIPVSSDKDIISTTSDFIFPGKIPNLLVDKTNPKKILFGDKPTDFPINEKSFNFDKAGQTFKYKNPGKGDPELKSEGIVGNLLNVFVKTKTFVKIYKESYTYSDFINTMFDALNDALFGLCKLEICSSESEIGSPLTIIDKKLLQPKTDIISENNYYRFKNEPLTGLMYEMSFNIEMSNLMQANALYESQIDAHNAINDKNPNAQKDGEGAAWEEDKRWFDSMGNVNNEGYYSIDYAAVEIAKQNSKFQIKDVNETKSGEESKPPDKEVAADPKNLQEAIDGKYIKFENPKTKTILPLIYEDFTFIQSKIVGKPKKASVLTYLECDITIDGIAGIKCGEMFKVSGVPELYNKRGAFQVLNIKQSIQPDTGWRTSINAGFRYNEA